MPATDPIRRSRTPTPFSHPRYAMHASARHAALVLSCLLLIPLALIASYMNAPKGVQTDPAVTAQRFPKQEFDDRIDRNASELLTEGRKIFRYDTFGSEGFWGEKLQLHRALLKQEKGGVGKGL